jgi:putative transcriptional regulator
MWFMLSRLKSGRVKGVRFETLVRICTFLQCQPGELLVYIDEPPAAGRT